jgi:hypothetical protein
MSLIDQLVTTVGLSRPQAEGAVGAIGRIAQGRLPAELFGELGRLVPGLSAMIGGAPKPSGMAALLGDKGALASVLSQLGIDLGKAGPIAQVVVAFIQSNGSDALKAAAARLV